MGLGIPVGVRPRMIVLDVDTADVLGVQSGFICNRSNDIPRLHFVVVSDFDTKQFHVRRGTIALRFCCLAGSRRAGHVQVVLTWSVVSGSLELGRCRHRVGCARCARGFRVY